MKELNKETVSVINFLEDNKNLLDSFYYELKQSQSLHYLSYSLLLSSNRLSGTTKEGVNFASSRVQRSEVTNYIKGLYVGGLDGKRKGA